MTAKRDHLLQERWRDRQYQAKPGELAAIDDADCSGVATKEQVAAAFRAFRSGEHDAQASVS